MGKLSCDGCSMCCHIFEIEELSKPFCTWCQHIQEDKRGCSIYEYRPQTCKDFKCAWLLSQDRPGQEMPVSMRPNHLHVMFCVSPTNNRHIYAYVNPSYRDAWKKGEAWAKIDDLVKRGGIVEVVVGQWRNILRAGEPSKRFHESLYDKGSRQKLYKDLGIEP